MTTGQGKRAAMASMLAGYAAEHPLGRARPWGDGVLILEPGPPVIVGQVVRDELEAPPAIAPGTPHPSPFLAGRGWKMGNSGVWVGISGGIVRPK